MFVEGIFDGTAVKPKKPLSLEPDQRVFIKIPKGNLSSGEQRLINEKLDALNDIFGMLAPEEKI